MRKLAITLLILALLACIALPTLAAASSAPCLQDQAGLLTQDEAAQLEDRLEAIADEYGVAVAIITVKTCNGTHHEQYARELYRKYGYGLSEYADGILLLICMDPADRGWAIYCQGLGDEALNAGDREKVGRDMTPDLRAGDYAEAFDTFVSRCESYIDITVYGDDFDPGFTLVISLIVGFLLALIVTGIMRGKLKSVRSQYAAADYVRPGSMHVTQAYEIFLYRTLEKRAKPKSSGSSRSGSSRSRSGSSSGSF